MTLYDIVSKAQYWLKFSIYLTNVHDQNIPIARGTRSEMLGNDVDNDEDFFRHLMYQVEYFNITKDGVMVVYIRDENYEKNASECYSKEYVEKWDRFNPKTRPWLWGSETEEYTKEYLWKFVGYKEGEDA